MSHSGEGSLLFKGLEQGGEGHPRSWGILTISVPFLWHLVKALAPFSEWRFHFLFFFIFGCAVRDPNFPTRD